MNRLGDHLEFAVRFAGLGYIVLWPLASVGASGEPFGAKVICGGSGVIPLNYLCAVPHPIQLPPTLHALGSLAAALVVVRFALHALRRSRRARNPVAEPAMETGEAAPAPRPREPVFPLKTVKPRSHFGLRGTPR